jgi:hypothetical protein
MFDFGIFNVVRHVYTLDQFGMYTLMVYFHGGLQMEMRRRFPHTPWVPNV